MKLKQSACYPAMKPADVPLDEFCRLAAEIGYEAIELWGWDEGLEQVVRTARQAGLEVASITGHESIEAGLNDVDEQERIVEELRRSIDVAARFEIQGVICTTMLDSLGTSTYVYDGAGQLTGKTENALAQTYVYDSVGNRTRLTDPEGKARTYSYDARGSVTSLVDVEGIWTTFQRDALGRVSTALYASGLQRLVSFTPGGRVAFTRDTTAGGATVMQALTYTYDGAGNPVVVMDYSASPTTYTYDDASRLVNAWRTRTIPYNATYVYDAVGNTLYSGENSSTFAYDAAGQIVTSLDATGLNTFSYDLNGNLTTIQQASGVTVAMLYDKENRLVVHDEGGTRTTFAYDGTGLKKVEQTSTSLVTLVWDGTDYLQSRRNNHVTQFYTVDSQILAQRDPTYGGGRVDYLLDALGSVLSGIHQGGGRPYNARFMPYGTKTSLFAGTIQDFLWVGSWGYRPTQRSNLGLTFAE